MEEFDYLNSNLSKRFGKEIEKRSEETFEVEVRERARLLFNLGYGIKDAVERIKKNIEWECDDAWTLKLPGFYEKVEAITKDQYDRLSGKKRQG